MPSSPIYNGSSMAKAVLEFKSDYLEADLPGLVEWPWMLALLTNTAGADRLPADLPACRSPCLQGVHG